MKKLDEKLLTYGNQKGDEGVFYSMAEYADMHAHATILEAKIEAYELSQKMRAASSHEIMEEAYRMAQSVLIENEQ